MVTEIQNRINMALLVKKNWENFFLSKCVFSYFKTKKKKKILFFAALLRTNVIIRNIKIRIVWKTTVTIIVIDKEKKLNENAHIYIIVQDSGHQNGVRLLFRTVVIRME